MRYRLYVHDMDIHMRRDENEKSLVGEFPSLEACTAYLREYWWPVQLSSVEQIEEP